ncbi:hypothetical protein ASA1KI_12440 [Opitutales bacterium ASA1]|uniref:universal stress protein n=1 Tax=Congregicoccus parvus TaxID=3081749 RepID=UPI002B292DEC|nr:hypothetical protein ASA1KI_12440 [Opitutales bacterium ASA1]
MKRFQEIAVYLSLKDTDAAVLEWASLVARLTGVRRITVVHARRASEMRAEQGGRHRWSSAPGEQSARDRVDATISKHLQVEPSVEVASIVTEATPLGALSRVAEERDVDLVVCGRQMEDPYSSETLARKMPCSLLSVPSHASTRFRRVVAAVDYSEFSRGAAGVAYAFASAGGAEMTLFHAFEVPWGQGRTMVSRETLVERLRSLHERRLREWVAELAGRGVSPGVRATEAASPSASLVRAVTAEEPDLVVIGCRGYDAIYATLLGSTAEAILRDCRAPVLAVKARGCRDSFATSLRASA